MSQPAPESQPAAAPAARASVAPGVLIFISVWAVVFAAFIVLGLRS